MNGQLTIFEYIRDTEDITYGHRGCRSCCWYRSDVGRCQWAIIKDRPNMRVDYSYPSCEGFCLYQPSEYKVPQMCGNCKWANQFEYDIKPEYEESVKRNNGYTIESADDPLEEPNIYCTHRDGSLNRRTEYKDIEQAGFGVGHWHRQHEWDTCDRWELDAGGYRRFDFGKKGNE